MQLDVPTAAGPARVRVDLPAGPARLLLVLGHGAGGGVDAADLVAVRTEALAIGAVVARVEQPYLVAGRRAPAPAGQLDAAWATVVAALRQHHAGLPMVAGGRSSGARVACRTARATGAVAVLALAFPLRPPWRPDRTRAEELLGAGVPVLVINGDRDTFGVPGPAPGVAVHVIAGADHSLRSSAAEAAAVAAEWLGKQSARLGVGTVSPPRPEDR